MVRAGTGEVMHFFGTRFFAGIDDLCVCSRCGLPPGGANFAHFPFGENTLGRALFEAAGIDAAEVNAVDFSRSFEARERILNATFIRKDEHDVERVLIVNGTPVLSEGRFEGYRCTVSDITKVGISGKTSD